MKSNSASHVPSSRSRRLRRFSLSALALASLAGGIPAQAASPAHGPVKLTDHAKAQVEDIMAVKKTFTPEEKKMSSSLVFARRKALGQNIGEAAKKITPNLGASSFVKVEIRGRINEGVEKAMSASGAVVSVRDAAHTRMVANTTLDSLESLAKNPDVSSVRIPMPRHTNAGHLVTEGYVSMDARNVIKTLGYTGKGVKVGVLSDSASPERVAALQALGELGPNTKVLDPGPSIADGGTDEGAAIMEIVQDIAPDATVEFATAYTDFPGNIVALQKDGCQVIVDDLGGPEGVFQDDLTAQAVNQVTAAGTIYLSSAGNSGNVAHGTSGCWEGDFNGDQVTKFYTLHNFGTQSEPSDGDPALATGEPYQFLTWADPLGTSTNDYDFFVFDEFGNDIKGFSVDTQDANAASTGDSYPFEILEISDYGGNYDNQAPGDVFVIGKTEGAAPLAMHMDNERGVYLFATNGATYGHNAAANTVCVAASYWDSAEQGVVKFDGASNPVEVFSSDGPRKIFFKPDGTPITPGNFLFATKGGQTLSKPSLTAPDGVTCQTPGFLPFFGTSAAGPHAAGVAAEIISARAAKGKKALTPAQMLHVLDQDGTFNNEAPAKPNSTYDPAGGFGTLNAPAAVKAALALP